MNFGDKYITSGKYLYDTEGKLIQAHGGYILPEGGKFYWFGEDKTGIYGRSLGEETFSRWHNGIRLYVSEDLVSWEDKGIVAVGKEGDKLSPFSPANITERPHVIYNEKTKKYVMWVKTCGPCDYSVKNPVLAYAVAVSDKIDGKYEYLRTDETGRGGDFDLIKVGDKAYLAGERPHDAFCLYELDETYTEIVKEEAHFEGVIPPWIPEAPCAVSRGGKHYFVCSHTTGYFPNPAFNIVAKDLHGKWKKKGRTFIGDKRKNSFNSQISCIFKVPESDLYVALADRWLVDLPEEYPSPVKLYDKMFKGDKTVDKILHDLTAQNTSLATYCFFPVGFSGSGEPRIKYCDKWRVKDFIKG